MMILNSYSKQATQRNAFRCSTRMAKSRDSIPNIHTSIGEWPSHMNFQATRSRSWKDHVDPGKGPPSHKRLLVIDDNEDIQMLVSDRLQAKGYEVLKAGNGLEALNLLEAVPVVGLLLDIEMPVMDGLTFLMTLKQRRIRVPVLVMSAGSTAKLCVQALELGATDYLEKPIDLVLLEQKCLRLFG